MSQKKIEELELKLAIFKENRETANREADKWIEKRNTLLDNIEDFRREIKSLKEKRDALNNEVKKLKILREQTKTKRNEIQKDLLMLEERMKTIMKLKPIQNMANLKKEIEDIDWKIQTTSLSSNEEKYLVDQIKILETKMSIYKRLQNIAKRIDELRIKRKSFAAEASLHHEKLSELAKQSQEIHEEMISKVKRIYSLQSEVNDAQRKYQEKRQLSQEIHQQYVKSQNQVRSFKQGIRLMEAEKKAKVELEMRERMKQRSLEKLKRGEKLSWEEFQVLTEDGLL